MPDGDSGAAQTGEAVRSFDAPPDGRRLRWAGFTVLWFLLWYGVLPGCAAVWLSCRERPFGTRLLVQTVVLGAGLALFPAVAARAAGSRQSLVRWTGAGCWSWKWFFLGPFAAAALLPAAAAVTKVWLALAHWCGLSFAEPATLEIFLHGGAEERMLLLLLALFFAPLWEELAFRNGFYRLLRGRLSGLGAALASGTLFALMHNSGAQFPGLLFLALVWQWARERSGSFWSTVILHFWNNFWAVALLWLFWRGGAAE